MKIFLYVGLPKTATTFYQSNFFPFLSKNKIIYNPNNIMLKLQYFLDLKDIDDAEPKKIIDFKNELINLEKTKPNYNLLIVNEHLGYVGINPEPRIGSKLTKKLFDKAEIIISLRYQTDWLLSFYRHYMDNGGSESIEKFLNFQRGEFLSGQGLDQYNNLNHLIRRVDVHLLDWCLYVNSFYKYYSRERVNVLFFEDFKRNKEIYTRTLFKIIQAKGRIPKINYDNIKNRGRSAFTCLLIENKNRIYSLLNIKSRSIRKFNIKLKQFRETNNLSKLKFFNKILYFIKLILIVIYYAPIQFYMVRLDKIIYLDWDLLSRNKLRQNLDIYFKNKNKDLLKLFNKADLPKKYLN